MWRKSQRTHISGCPLYPLACLLQIAFVSALAAAERLNIMLIYAEDISPDLACYGEPAVNTPNLDRLAAQGERYNHAFTQAPSCTPARNAMLLGAYQTRLNLGDQRLSDPHTDEKRRALPEPYRPFPIMLREAGYHTALGCGYSKKVDHNFKYDEPLFEANDWENREDGQPFFRTDYALCDPPRVVVAPKPRQFRW